MKTANGYQIIELFEQFSPKPMQWKETQLVSILVL